MRRLVILCRHGNTFKAGEKVVMVGAREDLPLTDVGEAQAHAVAGALQAMRVLPQRVYSGPLQRTKEFARLIIEQLGATVEIKIDARLTELDYGAWGGLSDQEITEGWGASVLEAWHLRGVRPQGVQFFPSESELQGQVGALLDELCLHDGVSLVVSSNGRLREFGRQVGKGEGSSAWKVRTGKVCVLEYLGEGWRVLLWDAEPMRLAEVVAAS
jgi:broad specificity phosphatase PhoE